MKSLLPDDSDERRPSPGDKAAVLGHRWFKRNSLEMVACIIIGVGLFMLLQPFALILYTWSFLTMLTGTVMFMVVSKFPE